MKRKTKIRNNIYKRNTMQIKENKRRKQKERYLF